MGHEVIEDSHEEARVVHFGIDGDGHAVNAALDAGVPGGAQAEALSHQGDHSFCCLRGNQDPAVLVGVGLESCAVEHIVHIIAEAVQDKQHGGGGVGIVACRNVFYVLAYGIIPVHCFGGCLCVDCEAENHSHQKGQKFFHNLIFLLKTAANLHIFLIPFNY